MSKPPIEGLIRSIEHLLRRRSSQKYVIPIVTAVGAVAVANIVISAGQVGPVPGARPLWRFYDLIRATPPITASDQWPGRWLLLSVVVLAGAWIVLHRAAERQRIGPKTVAKVACVWAIPLAVAPPFFSADIYSYTAQGLLQLRGLDPYRVGPSALAPSAAAAAVDPRWRDSPSPYGPLASALEHLASVLADGNALITLLILRTVEDVSVVLAAWLAMHMVSPARRSAVLSYLLLSPLVLLEVVSAGHWEGLLILCVLGATYALQRQCWTPAVLAATAAFMIKGPALLALAVVCWVHASPLPSTRHKLRLIGHDLVVAATAYGFVALFVPDHAGWIRGLNTPASSITTYAPTTLILRALMALAGAPDLRTDPVFLTVSRDLGLVLAISLCIFHTIAHRRRSVASTVGICLLTVALLAPVMYPWYLLWAAAPLVVTREQNSLLMTTIMGVSPLLSLPGLAWTPATELAISLGAAALLCLCWWQVRGRPEPRKWVLEPTGTRTAQGSERR